MQTQMSQPMEAAFAVESFTQVGPSVAAALAASADIEIKQLAKDYQFNDGASVESFLSRHASLLSLLREAHHQIKSVFGFDTDIALEVFTDPDSDDGSQLFALILTALPVNEALAQLERLDQNWWFDAAPRAAGLLNLDVEYV